MINLNTNLSSLITQNSLKQSTNRLNVAIERMTTGFKINHAKDNAANYNITTNMTTKIGSYEVAEDNTEMAVDVVTTASDSLSIIEDRLQRLRALQEQALNGTYGAESMQALNSECNSLVDEINRLYLTTEYNGVNLFLQKTKDESGNDQILQETIANESTKLKELNIEMSSFSVYDSSDNLVQSYDTEAEDTIGDIFEVLSTHGFSSKIENGEITITSDNGSYVMGDLADSLGLTTSSVTYVESTNQTSSTPVTYESVSSSTTEEIVDIYNTNFTTVTETLLITTTSTRTETETVCVTTTTGQTMTDVETQTIAVETDFLKGFTVRDTSTMLALSSVYESTQLTGVYSISTPDELIKLSEMVSLGLVDSTAEFVLANDIDMSSVQGFTPIGGSSRFSATFDGNGFVISNLKSISYASGGTDGAHVYGLFGATSYSTIRNLGIENFVYDNITDYKFGVNVGGLVGFGVGTVLDNCWVKNTEILPPSTFPKAADMYGCWIGGLLGCDPSPNITNSYTYNVVISSTDAIIDSSYEQDWQTLYDNGELYSYEKVSITEKYSTIYTTTISDVTNTITQTLTTTNTVTNTNTLWTTTTSQETKTITHYTTLTEEASGTTTFGDMGVKSGFSVTVFLDGTKINLNVTSAMSIDQFLNSLITWGFRASFIDSSVSINGTGDSYVSSTILTDLFNLGALNKTEAQKTINNVSNELYCETNILELLGGDIYAPGVLDLQVGVGSDSNSRIKVQTSMRLGGYEELRKIGVDGKDRLKSIDKLLETIQQRQTELGSAQNRLLSVLEEISIQKENLVSSRSTLRDADISEVSSMYIQQQILQQASATLMATANQSPSIALQLI